MKKLNQVTVINFHDLSKSRCQEFHSSVADVIKRFGLDQEAEIKCVFDQYLADCNSLLDIVGLYRGLEITPLQKTIITDIEKQYRYFVRVLKSYEYDHNLVTKEELQKLNHEVLEVFPLSILRLPLKERFATFVVLLTHLNNDWMPLLQEIGLVERYNALSESVSQLEQVFVQKSEELSKKEKGLAVRLMNDLSLNYMVLSFYLEAWSNNWSQETYVITRREKALSALNTVNVVISNVKHSIAVAKSNRRRGQPKLED